jgi:nitrogen fixation/metabolism regulation signal transduction histidine kinase
MKADLELQRARTQAILDAMPDHILRFSPDGVLLASKQGSSIRTTVPFGYYVGSHLREFTPPELVETVSASMTEAIRTGAPSNASMR